MPVASGLSEDLIVIFWEWSGALSEEFFVVQFVLVTLEFLWQVLYAGKDFINTIWVLVCLAASLKLLLMPSRSIIL